MKRLLSVLTFAIFSVLTACASTDSSDSPKEKPAVAQTSQKLTGTIAVAYLPESQFDLAMVSSYNSTTSAFSISSVDYYFFLVQDWARGTVKWEFTTLANGSNAIVAAIPSATADIILGGTYTASGCHAGTVEYNSAYYEFTLIRDTGDQIPRMGARVHTC